MKKIRIDIEKSLAVRYPEIAGQLHPTKNGEITGYDISPGSNRNLWWMLPYDDPVTGKHFNFEWQCNVVKRVSYRYGCPYLASSNTKVWAGFNDLATRAPGLAKEWDAEKNLPLTPQSVTCSSSKKVHWICGACGHSWRAAISDRHVGNGCPNCSKGVRTSFPEQAVYYYMRQAFPDAVNGDREAIGLELDVYIPSIKIAIEYDGSRWHEDAERDLNKNNLCNEQGIKLIRVRESRCPELSSHPAVINVFEADKKSLECAIKKIAFMIHKNIDINILRDDMKIRNLVHSPSLPNSLANLRPELAQYFHPTKNGNLKSTQISASSSVRVWWLYPYDDPITGKHFDFEWQCSPNAMGQTLCPFLTKKPHRAWPGFNDLKTRYPHIAKMWDYEKNGELRPENFVSGSSVKVWWKCENGHSWYKRISEQVEMTYPCGECYKEARRQNALLKRSA